MKICKECKKEFEGRRQIYCSKRCMEVFGGKRNCAWIKEFSRGKKNVVERVCLGSGCGKTFKAEGKFNRFCKECAKRIDSYRGMEPVGLQWR